MPGTTGGDEGVLATANDLTVQVPYTRKTQTSFPPVFKGCDQMYPPQVVQQEYKGSSPGVTPRDPIDVSIGGLTRRDSDGAVVVGPAAGS
ncbi:hypothetical protein Pmani_030782 [Petrolisthes manimaculis]|uniref:Uncharacterized protein n=1 Tax=Petrolisthes manimaculis TaxID=1843537 RepID=A0AAE1TVJ9_9EUCA|nr:hypothetical protein Pmani_030782 [Petrolisthes manimaculis]